MSAETKKSKSNYFETLSRHEVPTEFREEHVMLGFRPVDQSVSYYLCTMFTKHNETANVWTHLLPFAIILKTFIGIVRENHNNITLNSPSCLHNKLRDETISLTENESTADCTSLATAMDDNNRRTFYLFMLTVLAYLFVSAAAHLFHSASKSMHYLAFYCDFATIAFYSFMSATTFYIYSSTPSFYHKFYYIYIPVAWLLALAVSFCCCFAKYKFTRPYPFIKKVYICGTIGTLYLWNIYPVVDRIISNDLHANDNHYIHIATFMLSVFFYSSGWPQKAFPGKCDFFFHGHQIFHTLISVTTWYQIQAIRVDMASYFNHYSSTTAGAGLGDDNRYVVRTDCWTKVSILFASLVLFSLGVVRHFYKKIELSLLQKNN